MTDMPSPASFDTTPAGYDEHLLPSYSTPLERALAAQGQRILSLPDWVIRAVWDVDRCPVHLLPYLAAAWSVDEWDPQWSEADKRGAIRESIWLHQHKGTIGALRRAMARLNLGVTVSEWFEHGGAPYTFRLGVTLARGAAWTRAQADQMWRVAIANKNVRSFLDAINITAPAPDDTPLKIGVAIVSRVATRPILVPVTAITAPRDYVRVGVAVKLRIRSRCASLGVAA